MSDRAKVRVVIDFETTLADDPQAYEGAATAQERAAKEKEYIEEGGDYLIQALSVLPHTMAAEVTVLDEEDPADLDAQAWVDEIHAPEPEER